MIEKSFQFILFDIIGTTVSDRINGESIIAKNFHKAFSVNGFEIERHQIKKERGKLKSIAIHNILKEISTDIQEATVIYHTFMALLEDDLMYFNVMHGFEGLLKELKSRKIKVGIGSGLPMTFIQKLIEKFGWQAHHFDYIASSESLGTGRPNPIMIHDAMHRLELTDKMRVLKVGDTIVDVQEAKNAGVFSAGILSGTTEETDFEVEGPDYIFNTLDDLLLLIKE